jgi:hypothetical protein
LIHALSLKSYIFLAHILKNVFILRCKYTHVLHINTELAIHALDQVHCWGAYLRLGISHYENFTPKFPAILVLKTMTARKSPLYFRTVGGQENHV